MSVTLHHLLHMFVTIFVQSCLFHCAYLVSPSHFRMSSRTSHFLLPHTFLRELTEAERARLLARLAADSDAAREEKFEWFYVLQAVTDHLVWGYAFLFHGFAFVLYSLSLFLVQQLQVGACRSNMYLSANNHCGPWILKLAGTTVRRKITTIIPYALTILRLTVPPNTLASLSIWFTVWVSSRYNARAPFIIGAAFVAIIGRFLYYKLTLN